MKIKVVLRTSKICKNGQSPLMLRFTHNRVSKFVSLGLSVAPCYWDHASETLTSNCPERAALQSQIDSALVHWKSHATLTLLAKQDCPLWLQYD